MGCNPTQWILPQPGQKTVTVSRKHLSVLEEKYRLEKEAHPGISFAAFIAESAIMELERRQLVRESISLSLVGFHDDIITIKDTKNKFFEVQLKNGRLSCLAEGSQKCIHVGFALALPEVRKKLADHY